MKVKYFATRNENDYGIKRVDIEEKEILCDACKKRLNSEKLKSIFEKVVL